MSGKPYKYSRGQAIAHLMRDHRRPIIQKLAENKRLQTVYIGADDELFTCLTTTIEWLPRLIKLDAKGRGFASSLTEGWPTEEEISACIIESEQRSRAC